MMQEDTLKLTQYKWPWASGGPNVWAREVERAATKSGGQLARAWEIAARTSARGKAVEETVWKRSIVFAVGMHKLKRRRVTKCLRRTVRVVFQWWRWRIWGHMRWGRGRAKTFLVAVSAGRLRRAKETVYTRWQKWTALKRIWGNMLRKLLAEWGQVIADGRPIAVKDGMVRDFVTEWRSHQRAWKMVIFFGWFEWVITIQGRGAAAKTMGIVIYQ